MRMVASWSGSTRSTGYEVAAAIAAPESEIPSDRAASNRDRVALERLAALDSARPPRGPALIAEADSRILAALAAQFIVDGLKQSFPSL